jgi:hypothetical protein
MFSVLTAAFSTCLRVTAGFLNRINVFLNLLDVKDIFGSKISEQNKFIVYRHLKGLFGTCSLIKYQKFMTDRVINFHEGTFSDYSDDSPLYGEVVVNIEKTSKIVAFASTTTNPFFVLLACAIIRIPPGFNRNIVIIGTVAFYVIWLSFEIKHYY